MSTVTTSTIIGMPEVVEDARRVVGQAEDLCAPRMLDRPVSELAEAVEDGRDLRARVALRHPVDLSGPWPVLDVACNTTTLPFLRSTYMQR